MWGMILLTLLVAGAVYYVVQDAVGETEKVEKRAKVPEFRFGTLYGNVFTEKQLKPGVPVIFMHFNPDCDMCMEEVAAIQENLDAFEGTQLVMVSFRDRERLEQFWQASGFDQEPGIILVTDHRDGFLNAFGTQGIPTTLIYDKNFELFREFDAQSKPSAIIKAVREVKNQ